MTSTATYQDDFVCVRTARLASRTLPARRDARQDAQRDKRVDQRRNVVRVATRNVRCFDLLLKVFCPGFVLLAGEIRRLGSA